MTKHKATKGPTAKVGDLVLYHYVAQGPREAHQIGTVEGVHQGGTVLDILVEITTREGSAKRLHEKVEPESRGNFTPSGQRLKCGWEPCPKVTKKEPAKSGQGQDDGSGGNDGAPGGQAGPTK